MAKKYNFDLMSDKELLQMMPRKSDDSKPERKSPASEKKELELNDNATFINNAIAAWGLRPVDLENAEDVQNRILMYFQRCADSGMRPTLPGVFNYLQIGKSLWNEWLSGKDGIQLRRLAEQVQRTMEQIWADLSMQNKTYPANAIFLGKNWFGYKDQTDVVVDTQARREMNEQELWEAASAIIGEDNE